ncbi:NAD(P)H-dependent FMN reductase C4B3.06c [Orchesella cincta]|uniref:NAD(P)H-dependent FMN reductase C4B3.06c n=1 Tax=Orchesella cincta TaxID=48709 RepID=A0A1D2NF04_ORCCI|nr:NAD(P)H-dependent FMN reductase C4B3.06c [Orchesella cincta]
MPSKILIFLGSVRPGRLVERVGIAVKNIVIAQGMEPEIIDPAELPFEVVKVPLFFMKDPEKEAPEWLLETNKKIQDADGFIVVSAEYNCSIPPALSNINNSNSPFDIGTYGGIRATVILRPFLSELGTVTVPTFVSIVNATENIKEDGTCVNERISNNLTKLVKEVGWYATAIGNHKVGVPPPQ